jgi:hypothetical protein
MDTGIRACLFTSDGWCEELAACSIEGDISHPKSSYVATAGASLDKLNLGVESVRGPSVGSSTDAFGGLRGSAHRLLIEPGPRRDQPRTAADYSAGDPQMA